MSKFHVNPKTGNPGICKAKEEENCPFAGLSEHYTTREEAQAAYEKVQSKFEHFNWKSNVPQSKGAYTLAIYDPMSEEVPKDGLWGNRVFTKFSEIMKAAPAGSRVVIENGQVFEKSNISSYEGEAWKFVEGPYDPNSRLEKKRTYYSGNLSFSIKLHGARLEAGGTAPKLKPELRAAVAPDLYEVRDEAKLITAKYDKRPAKSIDELEGQLSEYVTKTWYKLNSYQQATALNNLRLALGEPKNIGDDSKPAFSWAK